MVHEIDSQNVDQVIASEPMCIITFGADWCIDCRRAKPFYAKFSEEFKDVYFTHCDVGDREGQLRQTLKEKYQFYHLLQHQPDSTMLHPISVDIHHLDSD